MKSNIFEPGKKVKLKNPELLFQRKLRYIITKENIHSVQCYEESNPSKIYKGIKKSLLIKS